MNPKERFDLKAAFEGFTQETLRLEKAYNELRDEFTKLQVQLTQSHLTLESIVSHISQGLLFVQGEGTISIFNPAAEALLRVNASQVIGSPFSRFFVDTLFGFSMEQALGGNLSTEASLLLLERDGQALEIEVSMTFLPGSHARGVILLLRDLTEIRFLEKAAKRGDRLKELGEMAAGLAHEIRNPLAGIEGFAALLEDDLKKERPDLTAKTKAIIEGTRSLNRLVTNVLEYSRPLKPQFASIDIKKLIRDVARHLGVENQKFKQRLILDFTKTPYLTYLDPDLIRFSLFNLLLNALQASPEGMVRICLKRDATSIVLSISDSGPGILPGHLEKLFTPFFTTKEKGNGLGLSEVYKVIEAHGGTIKVDSKAGEGATFAITLPNLNHTLTHGNRKSTYC